MYSILPSIFISILIFFLIYLLLTSKKIKWKLMYKYGFLFIGIFVFINLVLYPLLINTQFSRFGYLLGIGPGIAIINLLGIFGIHPILTKLVLASIYSLCVYFLFGAALGSIIEYSKKLKKKTKNKKKLKKNKKAKYL
jgi:hypothetical protein